MGLPTVQADLTKIVNGRWNEGYAGSSGISLGIRGDGGGETRDRKEEC
jgi:hypothetical protein